MIKNRLDYKLINLVLVCIVIFLLYATGNLWIGIIHILMKILTPFIAAFILAYSLYPLCNFLQNKGINRLLSISIVVICFGALFGVTLILVVPLLFNQLGDLFNGIIAFVTEISNSYDINFGSLQQTLSSSFNNIILSLGKYASDGAINVIGSSLGYLTIIMIAFAAAMYLLADMAKIREMVKKYSKKKSKKLYLYIKEIDMAMHKYLIGFIKVVLATFLEYAIAFSIIGHPNALLLGFLAGVASLIPYFGGMFTNVIASITAFVISPALFIKTLITVFVVSMVDSYVVNPFIYGKSNEIHPILIIFGVFAGGILFGLAGVVISLPFTIFLITTLHYFKKDISEKIEEVKEITKND